VKEPNWITREECLAFHAQLLTHFGGLDGMRDEGLLESALNRPKQLFYYGKPDLFDLAAAYAEGIVKNHPFLDGNKRSGLMAAALFLETNGLIFNPPEEEAVLRTLALAAGEEDAAVFGAWLRHSCEPKR
jgi:death-on-curing protein